jgi:hypothetical protein
MVFYGIVIVAALVFGAWFVRTPSFRGHLRSSKDPGDAGTRVDGKDPGTAAATSTSTARRSRGPS